MLERFNIQIFKTINSLSGACFVFDKIAIITAKYLFVVFIIYLLYLWFKNVKYKNISLYSLYSAVLGLTINFLITKLYYHPRPFAENIGNLLVKHAPDSSFPSDHTTLMLSIAIALLYFKKTRKAGILLSLIGLVGGIARVYCGIHFPLDIIGSIIVASISSFIVFSFKNQLSKINEQAIILYNKILNAVLKIQK